jgi:FemAB-related protein (PEP-CTERM system-associated)
MRVRRIGHGEGKMWDAFVSHHPSATQYHQYAWRKVIEESFGHSGYYLVAETDAGECRGILPLVYMKSFMFGNFLVSVPFVNYGGLLCTTGDIEKYLLKEAETIRYSCRASHVELRHLGLNIADLPTRTHKVTMILPLAPDSESQWKGFNAKLRNQIRKAEKSGLVPVVGQIELLDGFYEVFARNMRDLGTPVYAKEFFRNVLRAFPDSSRIIGVKNEGRIIAAGIACWFRDVIEIPWASSVSDYKNLCPNNMLYWEAIKFAIGKGFEKFDFGRSTPHEGTYNFKKQWGAVPVQLYWQYLLESGQDLPELNPTNPKYGMAIKVWQKLPLSLTKMLGPHIVRNIP